MRIAHGALALAAVLTTLTAPALAAPLSTKFTYQGELQNSGLPAAGTYDFRFRLFDASSAGAQVGPELCLDNVAITAGRFSAGLDFGAVFTGEEAYLEVRVRADSGLDCTDDTGFDTLAPRQELTLAPSAAFALTAANATTFAGLLPSFFTNAANLTGTINDAQLPTNLARLDQDQTFSGVITLSNAGNTLAGNGAGITDLNGGNIQAGTITRAAVGPDIESVLSQWTPQPGQPTVYFDAIAWGDNTYGQTDIPALPPGVTFTSISAGGSHTVGLCSDGTIVAWGDPSAPAVTDVPPLPPGLTYTKAVAGASKSLGLRSDGTLIGWGLDSYGDLDIPALPPGVTYTDMSAGLYLHALALRSDGSVIGWGLNALGQTNVPALPPGVTYTRVSAGFYHSLAMRSDGSLVIWGGFPLVSPVTIPAPPSGVSYVDALLTNSSAVALRSDGSIVAWSLYVFDAQTSTLAQLDVPALPLGLTYTALGSTYATYALRSDGSAVGLWTPISLSPPALPSGVKYTAISGGGGHAVALRSIAAHPRVSSATGLSIGSTDSPPAEGGLRVAGTSSFDGGVSAAYFSGSGLSLTDLNASNLTSGLVPPQRLSLIGVDASGLNLTPVDGSKLGNLDASKLNRGVIPQERFEGAFATGLSGLSATGSYGGKFSFEDRAAGETPGVSQWVATLEGGAYGGTRFAPQMRFLGPGSGWFDFGMESAGQFVIQYSDVTALAIQTSGRVDVTGLLTAGSFQGDGAALTNLDASSLATGTVPAERLSLAGADGSGLSNLNAANITTGTLANARTTGASTNTPSTLVLRDASGNFAAGTITAASFSGSGASLTGLNAANLATGTVPAARLNLSGVDGSGLAALNAANITTGTLANARTTGASTNTPSTLVLRDASGDFSADTITATAFAGSGAALTALNANNISAGTLGAGRLPGVAARTNTANAFGNFTNTFAGDVGIGTASPAARFHVTGPNGSAFQFTDFTLTSGTQLVAQFLGNTAGPQVRFQPVGGGAFMDIGQNAAGDFVIENNDAARFILNTSNGNVQVVNALSKGGGSFKIDHPLDPENKYLYHSFVESPDMMNIYNGAVITDANGYATIELPDYFEALNRDFRYQLTVVDDGESLPDFVMTRVVSKIKDRRFVIKSSLPNVEVSWQVTGIRQDAWANQNRIPTSVDKEPQAKGKLLHPEAFKQPASKGIHHSAPVALPAAPTASAKP